MRTEWKQLVEPSTLQGRDSLSKGERIVRLGTP